MSVYNILRFYGQEKRSEAAPITHNSNRVPSPESFFYSGARTMSSPVEEIDDDEQLYKMLNNTDNFDERRKIRARIKEIRQKKTEAFEARRQSTDLVKQRYLEQEELKRKKMERYGQMAMKPTCENFANTKERHATNTQTKSNEDGSHTTTTTTSTEKSQKGIRPQGPRGAMAAFKKMDAASTPRSPTSPTSPNYLSAGGPAVGGGGSSGRVVRSASAVKQILLDWCHAMTREYENVNITNFSSCWTNGLAFCALIHHFYPEAFEYDQLKPENRRYNFNLAFDTAEKCADIAPLLDVEDMVVMKKPDWKCVFTYVQSIYRHLRDHERNKTAIPPQ